MAARRAAIFALGQNTNQLRTGAAGLVGLAEAGSLIPSAFLATGSLGSN